MKTANSDLRSWDLCEIVGKIKGEEVRYDKGRREIRVKGSSLPYNHLTLQEAKDLLSQWEDAEYPACVLDAIFGDDV